jgi:ABC-2 type transport system permease protein
MMDERRAAAAATLRTLQTIALKDARLMLRYPLNVASRVIEPLGWLAPVYFLGRTFSGPAGAAGFAAWTGVADYMSFIIIGWVLSSYVSAVMWGMGFSLKTELDQGVLESNWVAPVSPTVLLVGRTMASIAVTTATTLAFLILAVPLFGVSVRGGLLPAGALALPVVVSLYGFGFLLAGIVLRMRDANTLVDVGNFVLGLVSGRDFPVAVLPRAVAVVSLLLPLTYGYDGIRAVLLGTRSLLPLPLQGAVAVAFMGLTVVAGQAALRRLEYRTRVEGSLAQH